MRTHDFLDDVLIAGARFELAGPAAGTFNTSTAAENSEAYKDYANSTKYKADWRDIISGSNNYQCKKGWEFCTGIGSPITYKGK